MNNIVKYFITKTSLYHGLKLIDCLIVIQSQTCSFLDENKSASRNASDSVIGICPEVINSARKQKSNG